MVESPFVRVGAVVVCASCGHLYRIADAHVERKTRVARAAGLTGESMMAGQENDEQTVDQIVRLAADGRVIGLSGLSELMRDEPMPQVASADDGVQTVHGGHRVEATSKRAERGGGGGGRAAREDVRRRNAHVLYVLVAIVVLAVAAVGGAVWYAMMVAGVGPTVQAPVPSAAHRGTWSSASSGAPQAAMGASVPYADISLVQAKRLPSPQWNRIHKPYEMTYRPRGDASISDEHRVFTATAEEHYTAQARTKVAGIVTASTLHMALVTTGHQALAQCDEPLSLFGSGRPEPLRVALPSGLPAGLIPDAHVEVHERMAKGAYLDNPTIEPIAPPVPGTVSAATAGMVLISAKVPPKKAMSHVVFIITALGVDNQVLARWRVDLHQEVVAEEMLRFRVPTSLGHLAGHEIHWELEAAGE